MLRRASRPASTSGVGGGPGLAASARARFAGSPARAGARGARTRPGTGRRSSSWIAVPDVAIADVLGFGTPAARGSRRGSRRRGRARRRNVGRPRRAGRRVGVSARPHVGVDLFGANGAEADQIRDRPVRCAGFRRSRAGRARSSAGRARSRIAVRCAPHAPPPSACRPSRAIARRAAEARSQVAVVVALEARVADELGRDAVERREFLPAGALDERFGLAGRGRSSRRARARRRRVPDRRAIACARVVDVHRQQRRPCARFRPVRASRSVVVMHLPSCGPGRRLSARVGAVVVGPASRPSAAARPCCRVRARVERRARPRRGRRARAASAARVPRLSAAAAAASSSAAVAAARVALAGLHERRASARSSSRHVPHAVAARGATAISHSPNGRRAERLSFAAVESSAVEPRRRRRAASSRSAFEVVERSRTRRARRLGSASSSTSPVTGRRARAGVSRVAGRSCRAPARLELVDVDSATCSFTSLRDLGAHASVVRLGDLAGYVRRRRGARECIAARGRRRASPRTYRGRAVSVRARSSQIADDLPRCGCPRFDSQIRRAARGRATRPCR